MSDSLLPALTPLAPAEIRARKRPLAVLFVFAAELVWALVIATPVHAWARRVWGAHPEGDAVLFDPGGRELIVWLGQTDSGLGATARTTVVLLALGAVLLQLPLGALLGSLAFSRETEAGGRAPRLVTSLRLGVGAFMPLCGLLALGTLAAIIVLVVGGIAAAGAEHGVADRIGDARAFTVKVVVFALFLIIASVIGVIVDLARAAVGREAALSAMRGTSAPGWTVMLRGLRSAFSVTRRRLRDATAAWAWRAAIGVLLIAMGYYASRALGGRGGAALTVLFLLHQLVVLARTALRASWLARALALVAPVQDGAPAPPSPSPDTPAPAVIPE